tara:strand:+ start:96 stop:1511 length:1416 start_codon:yes stop_codon:yes gene_type:complete
MKSSVDNIDVFANGGGVESTPASSFAELGAQLMQQPDYDASFAKYQARLASMAPQQPKMSIYDLASELGRGLLQTPNTGGASAYTGLGVGFSNVSQKLKADKEMYAKQNREIQMMAMNLAMQDEQKAKDFLNQIAIKKIDAVNKKVDYITLEYDEVVDGQTVTKSERIADTQANAPFINDLYLKKNAREIKPATTQINMPGGEQPGDKKAIDQIFKDQESFGEKAEASNSTIDQVNQARLLAEEIGEKDFGPFAKSTLAAREFISGLGYGSFLKDEGKIPSQKALNQLSMSFTMGIVSQTKGAISDREMKLFIQASPTLGSTYRGYMKQLELLERLAARDSDFYSEYLDEYTKMIDAGVGPQKMQAQLEKFAAGWKKNNPLFDKAETESLQDMVAGGDGGFDGAGLDPEFNRKEYQDEIDGIKKKQAEPRQKQTISFGIEGVADGSQLIGQDKDGNDVYKQPDGTYKKVVK